MAEAQSRPRLTVINGGGGDPAAELLRTLAEAGVPPEVLAGLDGVTDPDTVIEHLAAAGLLPEPGDAVAGLISGFAPLTERGTDALEAEISGYEFLAAMRAAPHAPSGEDEVEMLIALAGQVEAHGGPAALAMLRLLAVTGPHRARPAAAQAADRLIAGGLRDRPWVKSLSKPSVGTAAFGYGDDLGLQETVAVTFRYGRKDHAIAVLIDHHLGGGVKDIWAASEPEMLREGFRSASEQDGGIVFRDYTPAEAATILRRALDRPVCPEQPDQVADLEVFLELLRGRMELLPAVSAPAASPGARSVSWAGGVRTVRSLRPEPATGGVHRLKITISGSKPPIWRRIEVPSGMTLDRLHLVIQAAFGWENCHLWAFDLDDTYYGRPDRDLDHRDAASKTVTDVLPDKGGRLSYLYDFGDSWDHDVLVEAVLPAAAGTHYPRCVTGRRAGPPEDSGGIWGYEDLVAILADPAREEHADRVGWLGLRSAAEFDPAHVDLDEINRALTELR